MSDVDGSETYCASWGFVMKVTVAWRNRIVCTLVWGLCRDVCLSSIREVLL